MKIILTVIIALMQLIIAIIPIKGKLSTEKRFPKNFTLRGYILIISCIITTICTILLFWKSEYDDNESQLILKKELKSRDSLNDLSISTANKNYVIKLDSSGKKTIELLAKYGLKVDSAQHRIEKLVLDSTKIVNKIYNSEDPVFELCNVTVESKTKDSIHFKHFYCSEDATSYSIDFTLDVLCRTSKDEFFYIWKNRRIIQSNSIIKKSKYSSIGMSIPTIPEARHYIFYIKGTYKKFDGKVIQIDEITTYDFANDPKPHFGPPNAELYKLIKYVIENSK